MSRGPCSVLVPHRIPEHPRDNSEAEIGYHPGCYACQQRDKRQEGAGQ